MSAGSEEPGIHERQDGALRQRDGAGVKLGVQFAPCRFITLFVAE
jgi:hypothetical protein